MAIPAGSSPLGMFERLIAMFQKRKLSFQNVVIFNMDEYVGLSPKDPQSYHRFLWEKFFDHIDINKRTSTCWTDRQRTLPKNAPRTKS